MLAIKKRLGASVLLTLLSIIFIILLLPTSKVSELRKLALGTTIDNYKDLWKWGAGEDEERFGSIGNGTRIVVLGDNWVDGVVENGLKGRGHSWPQVLCEEINCTSLLFFAASQPSSAWPKYPPTGVYTSNEIHNWTHTTNKHSPLESSPPLPDLATQIQSFIALPAPAEQPSITIFILSFGFWDIYAFSALDSPIAENATDHSIRHIFSELNILYTHFTTALYHPPTNASTTTDPPFQIIFPKILDPTLVPGWIAQRPAPLAPSSIAEQQKSAVYLTQRWNQGLENAMGLWLYSPVPSPLDPSPRGKGEIFTEKDIIPYDLPSTMLDVLIEHHLEEQFLSDGGGFGTGESPFESVDVPCFHGGEVCTRPEEWLWWDAWSVSGLMNAEFGREVGEDLLAGRGMRARLGVREGERVGMR